MNFKIPLQIALTHLLSKKKQSLVAMLGVTFGISMFIIMISFMTGVNQFLEDMAMDNTPHIRVYNPIEIKTTSIIGKKYENDSQKRVLVYHQKPKKELPKIKNAFKLINEIESHHWVKGLSPQVSSQVFFNYGQVQIPGNIAGIEVEKQVKLFELDSKMDEGDIYDLEKSGNVIIMGKGLAEKMNVHVGDKVSVTTPEGNNLMLKVIGIFSFGITSFDESKSYASLATVQKILRKDPSYITELHIKLHQMHNTDSLLQLLKIKRPDLVIEDWKEANASILAGSEIRGILTGVVSFTLLLVAGFGIYNIMNMNIINKMKDIAILKATGFNGRDITYIFLFQSIIIGVIGALLGLSLGFAVSLLLSHTPFPAGAFFRISTFPVNFNPTHYFLGIGFGILTTIFAGFFPARKASKIDPVSIIRG